jgi:EpsD family peptidyl-prolyl cis-trans isomerase
MRSYGLLVSAAFALAACRSETKEQPDGQVVATIAGEEVTIRELTLELSSVSVSDPQMMKAAEAAALSAIINRKIFAEAAREQGLDKSADFQLARRRAQELLLAQQMQKQISAKIPRPTREQAERYIAEHPNSYAQRKIYAVDQIEFATAGKAGKLKEFGALKTLAEVEQKLLLEGMKFQKAPATIDALSVDPALMARIAKVAPGRVFLIPRGDSVVASEIRNAQVAPFSGEAAIVHAQNILYRESLNKAMAERAEALKAKAGDIKYKKGYEPPAARPIERGRS